MSIGILVPEVFLDFSAHGRAAREPQFCEKEKPLVTLDLNVYEFQKISIRPPRKGFFQDPPHLWKFQLSFIHFFEFFGLTEPPTPQGNPVPSVGGGGIWIFSGTAQSHFHADASCQMRQFDNSKRDQWKLSNHMLIRH